MNYDQLLKFDFGLSPRNPFHVMLTGTDKPSGKPSSLDMHRALHLGFMLEGRMRCVTRGQETWIDEGSCYLIAPWEPHGALRQSRTRIMLFSIAEEELFRMFFTGGENVRRLLQLPPPKRQQILSVPDIRSLTMQFQQELRDCLDSPDQWTALLQWNTLCRFFIELDAKLVLPETELPDNRLQKALELLHAGNGRMIAVEDAAKACGLGKSRFSHLFKEYYGVPFGNYELHYRLNGAAESLLYRNLTIKEIAEQWGFFDASHFNRYFKKHFGKTPLQYQNSRKPDN